jgi:GH3 auxin-responsive promoter
MLSLILDLVGWPVLLRTRSLARRFLDQATRADEIQRDRLLALISRHADSQFGRDHHFAEIRSPADFRRRVSIQGYDDHEPYINRVRHGDLGALFGPGTEVLMFAMTSGTTARPKTIPITRESLKAYQTGWKIWGILAFDAHPTILEKGMRPILQLVSDWRETTTPTGIPCGAITGLTATMQNPLVRLSYCMPPATMGIKDIEAKYYVALRLSVDRDLGAALAANPSTLLGIARLGDREKETLIRDFFEGTLIDRWDIPPAVRRAIQNRTRWRRRQVARRLEAIVHRTGHLLPRDYWPNLALLGNWTSGIMGSYLQHYPEFFGNRPVRDLGLIASEGRFTIPIEDGTPGGILDYQHHYFEFLPEDQADREEPETVEATELIEGQNYFILPTTAGGLYRYQIADLVRCLGYHGRAPILEFLNKGAHISSLAGEKLSEFQVVAAVRQAQSSLGLRLKSFLLLPTWGEPPFYSLLVESDDLPDPLTAERLAAEVDTQLTRVNPEYQNKRGTHRLGPLRPHRIVPDSWTEFQRRRLAEGRGAVEQYKQPCLIPDLKIISTFAPAEDVPAAVLQLGT